MCVSTTEIDTNTQIGEGVAVQCHKISLINSMAWWHLERHLCAIWTSLHIARMLFIPFERDLPIGFRGAQRL
jgi:hypothetical protein